jgi:hypothetical protein
MNFNQEFIKVGIKREKFPQCPPRLRGKKGKGKCHPRTGHKGTEGECRYSCTLSLTSALDGVRCQHYAQAALPSAKTRYPLYRRLGGSQGSSGRVWKNSPPPGFHPRTVQLVASRYTDWAILTHCGYVEQEESTAVVGAACTELCWTAEWWAVLCCVTSHLLLLYIRFAHSLLFPVRPAIFK